MALVAGLGLVLLARACVPLLPGYLSYATGLSGADLASARRGRMVLGSALFVLGFSFVFVALGTLSGALGDWLWEYMREISLGARRWSRSWSASRSSGLVPWLQRDVRVHKVPAVGLAAAPLLGVLFGLGWTPCIGPTLAAVQALALARGHGRPGRAAQRRLLARPRHPVHRRRAGLPPDARRRRLGAPAPGLGHPARRR